MPSPAEIADFVRSLSREDKLRFIGSAFVDAQDDRRSRAALLVDGADGSRAVRMQTRDGFLVFRLSAEDLAL